jgi:hypothetical protein
MVVFINFYTDSIKDIAEVCNKRFKKFCNKNEYMFYSKCLPDQPKISFKKNHLISTFLFNKKAEYIIWCDTDVYITNPNLNLLDYIDDTKTFNFSKDQYGLCAGFFVIKNNTLAHEFFYLMSLLGESDINSKIDGTKFCNFSSGVDKWEQNVYKTIFNYFPRFSKELGLISEDIIQNPDSKFNKDALAVHLWSHGWHHVPQMLMLFKKFDQIGYSPTQNWQSQHIDHQ